MRLLLLFLLGINIHLIGQIPSAEEYIAGRLIVKIKPQLAEKCNKSSIGIPSIQKIIQSESINRVSKLFPNHKSLKNKTKDSTLVDLSTIYHFTFNQNLNPQKIINQLRKNENVAYVELDYINKLTYTTSDTLKNVQWYLDAIQAYEAWDIQKGDTSVIIGVTDTGIDSDHPDLMDAIAKNYNDPINGIDDDGDGYIDNFKGWDVANKDNDPEWSTSGHGVNVSGIASAVTDNITGISGCGFNTRILPIRIDDQSTAQLTGAYEGIVYAADHGAFIITNSWGSHFYSEFAQEIVNYAAINKGALVIAATGNNGHEERFYPAAYENVLSVGSLIEGDTIKASSNRGFWVDLFAPGEAMFTTNQVGGYGYNGGTSMAAPVVAGVAALVKSQFPSYSAEQITQQLMRTADNIDRVNEPSLAGKLGNGRVNAFRAVQDSTRSGISFVNKIVTDGNDGVFAIGDTLRISGDFKNWLASANNVQATIKTIGNKLQIIDGNSFLGNVGNLNSSSNGNDPFLLKINPGLEFNELVEFEMSITADNYSSKEYFTASVNVDFITVSENNLSVTVGSDGGLGYFGNSNSLGEGIKYLNGNSLLYEGSFVVGNSPIYVADRFRGDGQVDQDFSIKRAVKIDQPSLKGDIETSLSFTDEALSVIPKLEIFQKNYFFYDQSAENSVVYTYVLKNISNSKINSLYAGLFMDWDIADFSKNKIIYDDQRRMGISFATDTPLYCGIRILTDNVNYHHYAIDNTANGNGGITTAGGFSSDEKYQAISTNRSKAGESTADGNDIIDVNSLGPFDLEVGESFSVSFVITIADSIVQLNNESDSIQLLYDKLLLGQPNNLPAPPVFETRLYPNPASRAVTFEFNQSRERNLEANIFNLNGKTMTTIEKQSYPAGNVRLTVDLPSLKTGIYFLEIKGNNFNLRNKFVITR